MTVSVAIRDDGEQLQRADRLVKMLIKKGINAVIIDKMADFCQHVLLGHVANVSDVAQFGQSRTDRLILLYTGGVTVSRDERMNKAVVRHRPVADVERLLHWASADWNLADWVAASEPDTEVLRERAFTVISTLATCASAAVTTTAARDRQRAWQTDPARWRAMLRSFNLVAIEAITRRAGKPAVHTLLRWLGGEPVAPDFGRVSREAAELA